MVDINHNPFFKGGSSLEEKCLVLDEQLKRHHVVTSRQCTSLCKYPHVSSRCNSYDYSRSSLSDKEALSVKMLKIQVLFCLIFVGN